MLYFFKRFLIIIFCIFNFSAFAQKEFSHTNLGLGIIYLSYEGYQLDINHHKIDSIPVNGFIAPITAYFDWNFPVIKRKDLSSFGINPGLTFSGGNAWGFSVPVFINYKYGADAQLENYGTRFGFTAGIGYQLSGYASEDFEYLKSQPVFMAEFNIRGRYSVSKIRLMGALPFKSSIAPKSDLMGNSIKITNYWGVFYLFNL